MDIRKFVREQVLNTLNESMNVHIKDFQYSDKVDYILDMCYYVVKNLYDDFLKKNATKQEYESISGLISNFQPDGMDALEPVGTINFYLKGYPERLVEQTLSYIKYILSEKDIKVGSTSREGDRVIRINIESNDSNNENHPELNLSNSNAAKIFEDLLGFDSVYDTMMTHDLLSRIKKARYKILDKPKVSSHVQQGMSFIPVHGQDYYNSVLDRLEELVRWAIKNKYHELYLG